MKTDKHILIAEMPYLFLSFLMMNKVLAIYCRYTLRDRKYMKEKELRNFIKSMYNYPRIIIDKSFMFDDTEEGFDFWYNLSMKWQTLQKNSYKQLEIYL